MWRARQQKKCRASKKNYAADLFLIRSFFFEAFFDRRFSRNKNRGNADNRRSKNTPRKPRISDHHGPSGNRAHEQHQTKSHPLAAKSCHVLRGNHSGLHLDSVGRLFFNHRKKPVRTIRNVPVVAIKKIRAWNRRRLKCRNMPSFANDILGAAVNRIEDLLLFFTRQSIKQAWKLPPGLLLQFAVDRHRRQALAAAGSKSRPRSMSWPTTAKSCWMATESASSGDSEKLKSKKPPEIANAEAAPTIVDPVAVK